MTPSDGPGVNLTDSAQVGHNAIGPTTGDIIINSGANNEICSMCKTPIDAVNNPGLFCFKEGCKTLFCNNCESFFRESREAGEKPYCADHIGEADEEHDIPPPPSVGAIVGAVLRDSKAAPASAAPPQAQIMGNVHQQVPMQTGAQVFAATPNSGMMSVPGYNPYLNQSMVDPIQAFINTISNWSGKGRAQRSEFWFGSFGYGMLLGGIFGIVVLLGEIAGIVEDLFYALCCGFIVLLIPPISLMIRRLQDTGNPGWYILLGLLPFGVGGLILIIFALLPSQPHPNKYDRR